MPIFVESTASALIEMDGPDARDFLQRLTTVNLNALASGASAPGFFLNAQGKIQAFFGIHFAGGNLYLLDCPKGANDAWKTALLSTIDRFTFAEKFTLKEVSVAQGYLIGEDVSKEKAINLGLRVVDWGKTLFGIPTLSIFGEKSKLDLLKKESQSGTIEDLEKIRIQNARPGIDHEIVMEANPLEIAMKSAIADQKGCYPGQEVIEKIIALGSPARGLVQIDGKGSVPRIGDKITSIDGVEIGKVTSVIRTQDGSLLLSLIRKTHLKIGIEVRFPESGSEGTIRRLAENQLS